MNEKNKNIENLYRDKFAGFKQTPPSAAWKGISRNLWLRSLLNITNILIVSGIIILTVGTVLFYNQEKKPKLMPSASVETLQTDNQPQTEIKVLDTTTNNAHTVPDEKPKDDQKAAVATTIQTEKASAPKSETIISEKTEKEPAIIKIKLQNCENDNEIIAPTAAFSANEYEGCAPLTISFTSNCQNTGRYFWDFGNGAKSYDENPQITYRQPGEYTVTLTAFHQELYSKSKAVITVYENPKADFIIADRENIYVDQEVQFANLSNSAASYKWQFGDGANSTNQNPVHTYKKAGIYDVQLTAFSDKLCTDSNKQQSLIVKKKEYNIVFPTAFRPNPSGGSDGRWNSNNKNNDIFHPITTAQIEQYNLKIYSKSGRLIFETDNIQTGWDGYHANRLMPNGVYLYICSGKFSNGDFFQKSGNLTLLSRN